MPGNIKLNEPITFGSNGTIADYEPYGMDLGEKGLAWTSKEEAGFSANFGALQADVRLQLTVSPYVPADLVPQQQVFVYVNGTWVGFRQVAGHQVLEFTLPRSLVSARLVRIGLAIPTAVSPKRLNLGEDMRKLGVALFKAVVVPQGAV